MSDNGAAAEDFYHHSRYGPFIRELFNEDYETMGQPKSFISYGPQWAEAGSSPFRYFKGFTTEGGIIAPMIMAGPGVERSNEIQDIFVSLLDIAPSIYELAGAEYPDTFKGKEVYPLKGRSLMSFASGKEEQVHDSTYVFALEHNIGRLQTDHDHAHVIYEELLEEWRKFASEVGVQVPPPTW